MLQHMRDASEKRYRYIRRTADTRIEIEMEMEMYRRNTSLEAECCDRSTDTGTLD